jgi:RNA polymerase sigma factor (sigma-70 family)
MSASGPVSNDPAGQEPLEELFGTVFDLADTIASRISADKVEMRLRHTLRKAGRRPEEVPAGPTIRAHDKVAGHSLPVTASVTRVTEAGRSRRDDPGAVALVTRASGGDQDAWHELVDRYAPLVYTICTRYRLSNHDIEDVGQNVWLLLVEQLGKLREPAALPGWIATTTARECLRVVTAANKSERLGTGLDDSVLFVDDAAIDEEILMAERNAALRAAFAELPSRCQQLLSMLVRDPPRSYSEIHAELGIPVGSIGAQRARCLDRLRRSSTLAALVGGDEKIDTRGGEPGP